MNQYEEERLAEIDKIMEKRAMVYHNDRPSSDLMQSYLEYYGGLLPNMLNHLDLDQLQNLHEVRFIADGAGYVDYIFKYRIEITQKMLDLKMDILPTSSGKIKVRAGIHWVDRY